MYKWTPGVYLTHTFLLTNNFNSDFKVSKHCNELDDVENTQQHETQVAYIRLSFIINEINIQHLNGKTVMISIVLR